MMNDRFSAQLRKHLIETADERPADGQLAAIVERLASVDQRHPLAARLAWFPGRVGPFPSAALRYGLIAAALLGALAAAALLAGGPARTASTVFEGTWTATDRADSSTLTLVVGAGTRPTVHFEDDFATGWACQDDAVKRFTADGVGEISGTRLDVSFPEGGGCILRKVDMPVMYYTYDEGTDTLLDPERVAWARVQDADQPATQEPATPPPPTPEPETPSPETQAPATQVPATHPTTVSPSPAFATPVPECIDLEGGGTYQAAAGSLSLTVTVPDLADSWWHGLRDGFHLLRAPCLFGSSVRLEASLVDRVYADACDWAGTGVEVATPAEAVAALAAQEGVERTGPVDMTLAGYAASRFDISVPADFDRSACTDGVIQLVDGVSNTDPGQVVTIYLVDVDGLALAIVVSIWGEDVTPALSAEVDAIVASLGIAQ